MELFGRIHVTEMEMEGKIDHDGFLSCFACGVWLDVYAINRFSWHIQMDNAGEMLGYEYSPW